MSLIKAIWLAVRIVRKPWAKPSNEPFDNISWSTAWGVSRNIIHPKKGGAA